jgi:hypothetical protein
MISETTERILGGYKDGLTDEELVRLVEPESCSGLNGAVYMPSSYPHWLARTVGSSWAEALRGKLVREALASAAKEAERRLADAGKIRAWGTPGQITPHDKMFLLSVYASMRDAEPTECDHTYPIGVVRCPICRPTKPNIPPIIESESATQMKRKIMSDKAKMPERPKAVTPEEFEYGASVLGFRRFNAYADEWEARDRAKDDALDKAEGRIGLLRVELSERDAEIARLKEESIAAKVLGFVLTESGWTNEPLNEALEAKEQAEAEVTKLRMVREWVSVDERLPEVGAKVWIVRSERRVRASYYQPDINDDYPWQGDGPSVTHWMYRMEPAPPEAR